MDYALKNSDFNDEEEYNVAVFSKSNLFIYRKQVLRQVRQGKGGRL